MGTGSRGCIPIFILAVNLWLALGIAGEDQAGSEVSHPPQLDGNRDHYYYLEVGQLYSRQVSNDGDSLLVGSNATITIGTRSTTVQCQLFQGSYEYKPDYDTKIYKRKRGYVYKTNEEEEEKKVSDYFVPITKEVSTCSGTDDKNEKISFERIVTVLMGHVEIFEVKYFDGIEIFIRHHLGSARTVKIREVKYLQNVNEKYVPIRYEGLVYFMEQRKQFTYSIADFLETLSTSDMDFDKEGNRLREVQYIDDKNLYSSKNVKGADSGRNLRIGSTWTEVMGSEATSVLCYKEDGVNPFPLEFRPVCSEIIKIKEQVDGKDVEGTFYARLLWEDFLKVFTPIKEEIWRCYLADQDTYFYRIVNEAVGRQQIKTVEASEGIIELIQIKQKTVRFKEVKYLDPVTKAVLKYKGSLRLELPTKYYSPHFYNYKVYYMLQPNDLLRHYINTEGYDLRVGSKWEEKMYDENQQVKCTKKHDIPYTSEFKTKITLKVSNKNELGDTYSTGYIKRSKEQRFIVYIKKDTRLCKPEGSDSQPQFLRIINEIQILVPVREIEFYDGVDVFETIVNDNQKSVRIREIKYVNPVTKKSVRFDGVMVFDTEPDRLGPDDLKYAIVNNRNEDDVFRRVGHFTSRNSDFKEFLYSNDYTQNIKVGLNGKWDLEIGKSPTNVFLDSSSTIVCTLSPEAATSYDEYLYQPDIKRETKEDHQSIYPDKDKNLYKLTITDIKTQIWSCKPKGAVGKKKIFRISNTAMLGADKFRLYDTVNCYAGVELSIQYNENADQKYSVPLRETIYRDYNKKEPIKFEGNVLFQEQLNLLGTGAPQKTSGTIILQDDPEQFTRRYHSVLDDIKYTLDNDWRYGTILSHQGKDLYLGSHWEKIYGNEQMTLECTKVENVERGLFNAHFRTRITQDNNEVHNQILFDRYFKDLKSEMWQCGDSSNTKQLLRIYNHFALQAHLCETIRQVLHRDGFTVFLGDYVTGTMGCTEIVEVKYMDVEDFAVVKYEGKIKLLDNENRPLSKKINSIQLKNAKMIETHQLPGKNVLHKKIITAKGLSLEIGSAKEGEIAIHEVKCVERQKLREIPASLMTGEKFRTKPRIFINKKNEDGTHQPIILDKEEFQSCFEFTAEIWDCKGFDRGRVYEFKRVMNELKPKEACPLGRVYHYDGVFVIDKPEVKVKEIKYIDKEGKIIDFKGFVYLEETLKKDDQDLMGGQDREVIYHLDHESMQIHKVGNGEKGIIMEIGRKWAKKIGSAKDAVLCERKMDHVYDYNLRARIFSNIDGKDGATTQVEMDDKTFSTHFDLMKQEVYICSKNQKENFRRVVNTLVALKDISYIYHSDGVRIESQVFPDSSTTTLITEIKYLEMNSLVVLKYEGEITHEEVISNKENQLFRMPSDYRKYTADDQSQPGQITKASDVKVWPLNILRAFARRRSFGSTKTRQRITVSDEFSITKIPKGCNIIMLVGSPTEKEFPSYSEKLVCMLDQWNKATKKRFLTKVVLLYENVGYELDAETILEHFNIKSVEVWICVNKKDTILKVVTTLQGTSDIYAVIHRDGVQVQPTSLINGGASANITETKFYNATDFTILKFDGEYYELPEITNETTQKQISFVESLQRKIKTITISVGKVILKTISSIFVKITRCFTSM